ncbi:methylmalonyl Co-A mutase-associated GTPase MeaB [Salsuginibacillus kocurii]|uniref:methylmalonyl Co-A mutase-associated GTPase MeaB n=1 Tax=Salsuginibacillus kocurii TaxID=427078 RepID=UPI0003798187|nr:methylmalonyl Co-A mutase-associated GTPase MeaB [Salsuginibacillus kocurii]
MAENQPHSNRKRRRRTKLPAEYIDGILAADRTILAQAITLVESQSTKHFASSQEILQNIMPYTGQSIRIGFTGVPGAGKSTLIEALGILLCEKGYNVAVLAVDPSSTVSKGSILGDKTRMEKLSKHPSAFVRPSPSSGTLGGVARKSRETLLLCEAAGFDVIIVETVGVGQSETVVRSMVDCFIVLLLTGAGDELQGMKKGVMEIADALYINKADGPNYEEALKARAEYNRLLHFLQPATKDWTTSAQIVSALTGTGIDEMWDLIRKFETTVKANGVWEERRQRQMVEWMESLIEESLLQHFFGNEEIRSKFPVKKNEVTEGQLPPAQAAQQLLDLYFKMFHS